MNMQVLEARRDTSGGYKVDVGRGERVGRVSSEWFSRPADERYRSLSELARSVRDRADRSRTRVVESALIHVEANRNDSERLALILPGTDTAVAPTHRRTDAPTHRRIGASATLSVQTKNVRIVPEARATGENSPPSHRVFVGRAEIGAAWSKTSNEGCAYLGLKLDDLSFNAPIYANLFDDEEGETLSLIWSRPNGRRGD